MEKKEITKIGQVEETILILRGVRVEFRGGKVETQSEKKDRTVDQMIQAARSEKQNIVEGCSACKKSSKSKAFLVNVAKSGLKELLEDYEDYLRVCSCRQWEDNSVEKIKMRELASNSENDKMIMDIVKSRSPEVIANIAIVLINQEDYLLYKFLQKIEKDRWKEPP